MKTIEQLQAEHEKQIAALKAERAIADKLVAAGLPAPDYVGGALYGAIGLTYRRVGNMSAAIDLMSRFPSIVPFAVLRGSFTIMAVESALSEKYSECKRDTGRTSGDYACRLDVRHIEDSPAPTAARLEFFTRIDGTLFSVSLEFGSGYIDSCPGLRPRRVETRGFRNRLESVTFNANEVAYSMADGFLSYGSGDMGPIKKSADHRYLFVSDHGQDECTINECSHAVAQLRNLAAQIGE
jgi:hypothetical protein